jgi:hypothetical protein
LGGAGTQGAAFFRAPKIQSEQSEESKQSNKSKKPSDFEIFFSKNLYKAFTV